MGASETDDDRDNLLARARELFTEARAAAALTARLPGGDKAWNAFNSMIAAKTAETKQAITWGVDPSWAIIPRTR